MEIYWVSQQRKIMRYMELPCELPHKKEEDSCRKFET